MLRKLNSKIAILALALALVFIAAPALAVDNFTATDQGQALITKMNQLITELDAKAAGSHTHAGGAGGDTTILERTDNPSSTGSKILTLKPSTDVLQITDVDGSQIVDLSPVLGGYRHGFATSYKDADELYVGAGVLEIDGTICELDTETDVDMDAALGASFGNNLWYCFGFKLPSSGSSLSAADLICSEIIPTWIEAKQGWYLPAPHTGGSAITSGTLAGGYAAAGSFIPAYNGGTSGYAWLSSDQGASVSGTAYIGYDFGAGNTCAPTSVLLVQNILADYAIASAKLQYSDNGSDWSDHETLTLADPGPSYRGEIITLSSAGDAHRYWRLLANDDPAAGTSWAVHYLNFISDDTAWVRIFNRLVSNGSAEIDANSTWAGDSYHHAHLAILNDTTPAYSSAEPISAAIPEWGVPVEVGGWGHIKNAATGKSLYIFDSAENIAAVAFTQVADMSNFLTWIVSTNSDGQIAHLGDNSTYTIYEIYQLWDRLPAGM